MYTLDVQSETRPVCVELLYNDQVFNLNLNLRTVKEFIWEVKTKIVVMIIVISTKELSGVSSEESILQKSIA